MSATSTSPLELAGYDVDVVRRDFPILSRRFGGRPLAYLDSANTSQKPQQVIDAISDHYAQHNANVARAMHSLGAEASEAYEDARDKVAAFIGAGNRDEVVFTRNATEALNLVARTLVTQPPGAAASSASARATRSSSPRWSTTPTSCRGSCCASAPVRRCAGSG
jgi:cysteine desulfurase/selenocysteine lyase